MRSWRGNHVQEKYFWAGCNSFVPAQKPCLSLVTKRDDDADKKVMSIHSLDLLFPFFVFAYGAMITFVLSMPRLMEIAEKRLPPDLLKQLEAHRWLAMVCLIVGAVWSLQNLWLGDVQYF
jgi:hypothetical protein